MRIVYTDDMRVRIVIVQCIFFLAISFCAVTQDVELRIAPEVETPSQNVPTHKPPRRNPPPKPQHPDDYLRPERIFAIEANKTSITVNTNVRDAAVYLNNVYQGRTPCTINNLASGYYELRVEKYGYAARTYYISVDRSQHNTFFIDLEKITGYISLSNIPSGARVLIDGNKFTGISHTYVEVNEGYHTVTVQQFGYNDFSTRVYVARKLTTPIAIEMTPAPFMLYNFSAKKKRFNPMYDGAVGSCNFTFEVTASLPCTLAITDEHGTTVYTHNFAGFTTWQQKFIWNGRDSAGKPLPDGTYTATISANAITQSATTQIDSSLIFHTADITKSGSGIGTLPAAFMIAEKTTFIGIAVQPTFKIVKQNNSSVASFYEIPVNMFFGRTPVPWFEWSLGFNVHAGIESTPLSFNIACKFGSSAPLKNASFCFAGILRYGYTSKKSLYEPHGTDIGNGIGGGIAFGIDTQKLYYGLSSECMYSTLTGNMKTKDSVWKNGAAIDFRPTTSITLKAWCALNSAFNGSVGTQWLRALDTGFGFAFKLGSSTALLNMRANALIYFNDAIYTSGTLGATYFF